MLHNGSINWAIKKQSIIIIFIIEAKYIDQCNAGKKNIYLIRILKSIKYNVNESINIKANNQLIMKLTANSIYHFKSKHIDIQYYKVRKLINHEKIELNYIFIKNIIIDNFIKSLKKIKY